METTQLPPSRRHGNAQFDRNMIAASRLVLSWSALSVIVLDPTEPDRFVAETYGVMMAYSLYSLYVFLAGRRRWPLPSAVEQHPWWIDTAACLVLISLSSGTNSIFFFFFFFRGRGSRACAEIVRRNGGANQTDHELIERRVSKGVNLATWELRKVSANLILIDPVRIRILLLCAFRYYSVCSVVSPLKT